CRHDLYERNYSGNHEQMCVYLMNLAKRRGLLDVFTAFAEQCMAEYGVDGWKDPTWIWDKCIDFQTQATPLLVARQRSSRRGLGSHRAKICERPVNESVR